MPSYFPENNEPKPMDSSDRSLQKINSLLDGGTGRVSINNFGTRIIRFTPVVDTSIYAAGDVLFNTTAVPVSSSTSGARGGILSVGIVDRADTAQQIISLYFFRSNVSLGTVNSAPSITDDNAEELIGSVNVTTSTDLGGCRIGEAPGIYLPFELPANNLFVAATTSGTPTFAAASGIRVRLALQLETPA